MDHALWARVTVGWLADGWLHGPDIYTSITGMYFYTLWPL